MDGDLDHKMRALVQPREVGAPLHVLDEFVAHTCTVGRRVCFAFEDHQHEALSTQAHRRREVVAVDDGGDLLGELRKKHVPLGSLAPAAQIQMH